MVIKRKNVFFIPWNRIILHTNNKICKRKNLRRIQSAQTSYPVLYSHKSELKTVALTVNKFVYSCSSFVDIKRHNRHSVIVLIHVGIAVRNVL